jgi:hypothetical protein
MSRPSNASGAPPRMNSRMVTDSRNEKLVLFGGDGQSHYLADTWLFDLKTRAWRASNGTNRRTMLRFSWPWWAATTRTAESAS